MITRRKSRYIIIRSTKPFSASMMNLFNSKLSEIIGSIGMCEANPYFVKSINDNSFIIKVSRGSERRIILALSFLKFDGFSFCSILTSGTIKALLKKYNLIVSKP
jgi:RNase P/RNase MRP subunit POP5